MKFALLMQRWRWPPWRFRFLQREPDPYLPHLPMTHAPFSSADPRKQIPFSQHDRCPLTGCLPAHRDAQLRRA